MAQRGDWARSINLLFACMFKAAFHDTNIDIDTDTDTDILARILARCRRVGRVGEDSLEDVGVGVDVVECGLYQM